MIKNNAHKYSISAMCKVLQIPRSTYYYESKAKESTDEITPKVTEIFKASRNYYGTRKIGRIMKQNGLVSNYTVAQYKPHADKGFFGGPSTTRL